MVPEHLARQGVTERLELVVVARGVRHAWRVEVARGRLGRARRPAQSFENTTSATGWLQVARIATTLRHLSAVRGRRRRIPLAA